MVNSNSPEGIVSTALLDVFKTAIKAPGTKEGLLAKIKTMPPKFKSKLVAILKQDSKESVLNSFSQLQDENFATLPFFEKRIVPVTAFEVIMVIGGLLVGVLSLPNIGDRIANMLRERFHISREAQFAISRLISSAGKIGSFILGTLITINKVISASNFLRQAASEDYNESSFRGTLVALYKNPVTRSGVIKAAYRLDDNQRSIIRSILSRGGVTANFSELNFALSTVYDLRKHRPQLEVQKPKAVDIVMTVVRVIAEMLAIPGMGFVISGILNSFIRMNQLDLLISGAVFTILGQFGKRFIDDLMKIKSNMIDPNAPVY
jgi:hypothetical protein